MEQNIAICRGKFNKSKDSLSMMKVREKAANFFAKLWITLLTLIPS